MTTFILCVGQNRKTSSYLKAFAEYKGQGTSCYTVTNPKEAMQFQSKSKANEAKKKVASLSQRSVDQMEIIEF